MIKTYYALSRLKVGSVEISRRFGADALNATSAEPPSVYESISETVLVGLRMNPEPTVSPPLRVYQIDVEQPGTDRIGEHYGDVDPRPVIHRVEPLLDEIVFPQAVTELRGGGKFREAAEVIEDERYPQRVLLDFEKYPSLSHLAAPLQTFPMFHITEGMGYDSADLIGLRMNCNFLGGLLQESILELDQGGRLLTILRNLYFLCKKADETGDGSYTKQAQAAVKSLSDEEMVLLSKMNIVWFHLQNLAERVDIMRKTTTEINQDVNGKERKESIGLAIQKLHDAGYSYEQVIKILENVFAEIVFTKHPTDIVLPERQRLLERIAKHLYQADFRPSIQDREEIKMLIKSLLLGNEIRPTRPTPVEEAKSGLEVLTTSCYEASTEIYQAERRALLKYFGRAPSRLPIQLRFGSWMASDRDGNPNVTAELTLETADYFRNARFGKYELELRNLHDVLALSVKLEATPNLLRESIQKDCTTVGAQERNWNPYQIKIRQIFKKLDQEQKSSSPCYCSAEFVKDLELIQDSLLAQGLPEFANCRELTDLVEHAGTFGFHTAFMDIRQLSDVHERVVGQLLQIQKALPPKSYQSLDDKTKRDILMQALALRQATLMTSDGKSPEIADLEDHILPLRGKIAPEERVTALDEELSNLLGILAYRELSEPEKMASLQEQLFSQAPFIPLDEKNSTPEARELSAVFQAIRKMIERDSNSVGDYIISMTREPRHLLEILYLMKQAGLWRVSVNNGSRVASDLDISPLWETQEAVSPEQIAGFGRELFSNPAYLKQLEARGYIQKFMLGPSDLGKEISYAAGRIRLSRAQGDVAKICREISFDGEDQLPTDPLERRIIEVSNSSGVIYIIHWGGGWVIARGGGRIPDSFATIPLSARNGRRKLTQQGEAIRLNFGLKGNAKRTLEQILYSLICQFLPREQQPRELTEAESNLLDEIAERSMNHYQSLTKSSDFWPWVLEKTPLAWMKHLKHANRPLLRDGTDLTFEKLRAIPYGSAFLQSRYVINGYFGVGAALATLIDQGRLSDLKALYMESDDFRVVVENASRELARARLQIAELYGGNTPIHESVVDEFEKAKAAILKITGRTELLEHLPVIQKEIKVRNPFADLFHLSQLEFMQRLNRVEKDLQRQEQALLSYNDERLSARAKERREQLSLLEEGMSLTMNGVFLAMQAVG